MSDLPYKFAIHPGYIFSDPEREVALGRMGFPPLSPYPISPYPKEYIGFSALIKCYSLDRRDCIEWNDLDGRTHWGLDRADYVHLHIQRDGDYAGAFIKAILKYEAILEYIRRPTPSPPQPAR